MQNLVSLCGELLLKRISMFCKLPLGGAPKVDFANERECVSRAMTALRRLAIATAITFTTTSSPDSRHALRNVGYLWDRTLGRLHVSRA